MTVADQLVEMLLQAGVVRVYGITGDSLNPVNDAIRRNGKIQWVHVRHEEVAAYAASMDAELHGIGCCMGSSGPGHVHLINGLYDANRSGNPVIAIASTCPSNKFGLSYFQETNIFKLFEDCSKYVYVANTPTQFPHLMQHAIQTAIEKRGVSVVGLPGDLAASDAVDVYSSQTVYETSRVYRPTDKALQDLANLLNSEKKISFYCGYGCRYAADEVNKLAAKLLAPIAFSFRGKIFFDKEDNEFATGLNGLLGYRSGYLTCNKADVLVVLGSDFPYSEFMPEKCKIVQIDEKPDRIGRRFKATIGLAGDIKDTVTALLPLINQKTDRAFLDDMRKEYKNVQAAFDNFVNQDGKKDEIHPEYLAHLVDKMATDDAIVTVDTGMTSVWAARFIKGARNRYLTGSFNHGSMANAMPMAIGAAISDPNRQVIALCGDGGLSMLLGDLSTIKQYNLPIKIIVFNNRSLGMVKLEMQVSGYIDWQTDMDNPDFAKVAEAMGIFALSAHRGDELEDAMKQFFEYKGPALLNVFTNPESLAMPPHITLQQMRGFMLSSLKKVFSGRFGDVEASIISNFKHIEEVF